MVKFKSKGEVYVIVQILLFCLILFGPKAIAWLPLWSDGALLLSKPIGRVLMVLGIGICAFAIKDLASNLSALPHPKEDSTLIQTGLYALVRHPIYCGLLLASLGWTLFTGSTLILFYSIMLFVLFELKSRREEEKLSQLFPDYIDYKARVKKLLPFVY